MSQFGEMIEISARSDYPQPDTARSGASRLLLAQA
jgi:hypothetical protein